MCSNLNSFTSRIQKEFFSVDIAGNIFSQVRICNTRATWIFFQIISYVSFAVELSSQYASLRAANLQSTSKLMIYKENLKKIDLPLALHILNQIVIFAVFFTVISDRIRKVKANWVGPISQQLLVFIYFFILNWVCWNRQKKVNIRGNWRTRNSEATCASCCRRSCSYAFLRLRYRSYKIQFR